MDERPERTRSPRAWLWAALAAFVFLWLLGPSAFRDAIPLWLPFLVALGLEIAFVASALRETGRRSPDRLPQPIDRARFGYPSQPAGTAIDDAEAQTETPAERAEPSASALPGVRGALLGGAALAALAALAWAAESRGRWSSLEREARAALEERLSTEASRIAGKPVTIRCDEERAHVGGAQWIEGVARVGGTRAYLAPERCHDLYRLAFRGEVVGGRTARAIVVLAHEAWHLHGVSDEGETECYALQSGVELGERLGLSEEVARRMMRQQLVENALRDLGSAQYRVPAECRDGGRLDLDSDDARFP
jgi:hypothetical protein